MSCFPKETTHTMKTSVVSTLIRGSMRWTNVSCLEIVSMVPMSKKVDSMLGILFFSKYVCLPAGSEAVAPAPVIRHLKSEARNSKHETIDKDQNSNEPKDRPDGRVSYFVSVIGTLNIRSCYGFRYSDFEFHSYRLTQSYLRTFSRERPIRTRSFASSLQENADQDQGDEG
jgi:hypothetical protein